jgi:hypothetical protein
MNLDTRTSAIERAAQAWATYYLWAQDQPCVQGTKNRTYTGPVADSILARVGISFTADPYAYRAATDEVIRRGYELAGGKHDRRGSVVGRDMEGLRKRADALRRLGGTYIQIAADLGVSTTSVYRMLKRSAA